MKRLLIDLYKRIMDIFKIIEVAVAIIVDMGKIIGTWNSLNPRPNPSCIILWRISTYPRSLRFNINLKSDERFFNLKTSCLIPRYRLAPATLKIIIIRADLVKNRHTISIKTLIKNAFEIILWSESWWWSTRILGVSEESDLLSTIGNKIL